MGNHTISNVKAGEKATDAVNKAQLEAVNATAGAGWNLTANGTDSSNVAPNATVDLANTDGNINITKSGNNVTFGLNSNITVGNNGKDGTIAAQSADGSKGVTLNGKDGSIGINGNDGTQGTVTLAQGEAGVNGTDGKDRIQYTVNGTTNTVATLNDGLKFVGNDGTIINRKLNETLGLFGGLNAATVLNSALVSSDNLGVRWKDSGALEIVMKERPTFSGITVNGRDGNDAEVKFGTDGQDGMSIVGKNGVNGIDGLTIRDKDGKDGVTFAQDGRITNVADGKDGKDAVNLDQLNAVQAVADKGWNLTTNGDAATNSNVKLGDTVDFAGDKNITVSNKGNNLTVSLNKELDLSKDGSVTVGNTSVNNDGVKVGGNVALTQEGLTAGNVTLTTTGINAGGNKVTGVANGDISATSTDAVNGSQLYQMAGSSRTEVTQADNIVVTSSTGTNGQAIYTVATAKDVNFDKVNVGNVVIDSTTNKVSGVEDGDISANSSEVVNGSQLYAVQQLVGGGSKTPVKAVTLDDGSVVNVNESNGYTLTTYNVQGQANYVTNNVIEAVGRMNEEGIKFFHVNDGVVASQAQAHNSVDSSAAGAYAVAVGYQSVANGTSTVAMGHIAQASGESSVAIGNGAVASGKESISIGTGNIVTGNHSGAIGDPSIINGDSSYVVGNNNNVATNDTFVLGNNVSKTTGNSVFLGSNSGYVEAASHNDGSIHIESTTAGTKALTGQVINGMQHNFAGGNEKEVVGVVSVGNVAQNSNGETVVQTRRVQNVAPALLGPKSTDAVNGSQLYATNRQVARNAQVINQVANHVHKVDRNARAGIAGALAAGGLYHATLPGKSMVAAGVGSYRGESAVAVGYSRLSDNGKIGVKFSLNGNTRGDAGAAASVGYQW